MIDQTGFAELFWGAYNRAFSSAESQKGVKDVERCSVENQKVTVAIDFVER